MAKLGQLVILVSALLLALAFPLISADTEEVPYSPAPAPAPEAYTEDIPADLAPESEAYPDSPAPAPEAYPEDVEGEPAPAPEAYPEEAPAKDVVDVVLVEGIVYCQSCKRVGSESLTDAVPLPYAQVSIVCKNYNDEDKVYKADGEGYFLAELENVEYPLEACKVKLVYSPDEKCNLKTNVNGGVTGASLRDEKKSFVRGDEEVVVYAAGPLAFRPKDCAPTTLY